MNKMEEMSPIPRPKTDLSGCSIFLMLLIALACCYGYFLFSENRLSWGILILCFGFGFLLAIRAFKKAREIRSEWGNSLMEKYQDSNIVSKIMAGEIWQGQTEEQVVEALNPPIVIDEKVLKTKTKRIYKYSQDGANRFKLRVTIENNSVVGWDKRD